MLPARMRGHPWPSWDHMGMMATKGADRDHHHDTKCRLATLSEEAPTPKCRIAGSGKVVVVVLVRVVVVVVVGTNCDKAEFEASRDNAGLKTSSDKARLLEDAAMVNAARWK